ncbi:efflux RND transporter periplasmic adaptor subunit [Maritimibacter fusiformis]|uniref:Efflux RND transporter periplasmic adaptor subunit n=1 Tax=Maritimibacter fusiformis TaxID=2603819 RepID=A0A5D0RP77_9RHOB|nr:efflux RND transporter periplasmic adaptor subunit [Maritimibacter fusiformis]TYB82796.1 efflux RND transporter periplasmic adaptor subunit [Maritimibacter fusiformis]
MRIIPILTAIVVVVGLFLFVFEREAVLRFAGIEAAEPAADGTTPAPAPETGTTDTPAGVAVIAIDSEAREIDSAVILRGRTQASREVELRAETSGKVVSAPIPKGTLVEAGDLMCEIEMGTREAALAEAEARLAEARANAPTAAARVAEAQARLDEAAINLNAAEKLATEGFAASTRVAAANSAMEAARAALTQAQSGASSAEAAIESATAGVAAARREIERTRISAPFAGVLETDTAELGSLLQPGSPCATILNLDPIRLVGFVAEVDVDRVTIGAPAGARLASGREVVGQVTFLSRSADPTTRTFRVEAEVANADLTIRDGQTAEILVQSSGRMAHLLPQSALTLNDTGALGVRVVGDGNIARFAPVEMLRDTLEGVWVAGLPDTARVIVVGQDYVKDGVALDVTLRETGS